MRSTPRPNPSLLNKYFRVIRWDGGVANYNIGSKIDNVLTFRGSHCSKTGAGWNLVLEALEPMLITNLVITQPRGFTFDCPLQSGVVWFDSEPATRWTESNAYNQFLRSTPLRPPEAPEDDPAVYFTIDQLTGPDECRVGVKPWVTAKYIHIKVLTSYNRRDQRFVGIDLGFVGIIGYFAGRSPPTEFDLPANIYDGLVEKPTGPRAVTPMVSALLALNLNEPEPTPAYLPPAPAAVDLALAHASIDELETALADPNNVACLNGYSPAEYGEFMTPLHRAAFLGNPKATELLLKHNVDVNLRVVHEDSTNLGFAALHLAATKNNLQTAQQLLEHGAEVNLIASGGITPLFLAAQFGFTQLVEMLLEKGADVNAVTSFGTPLQIACQKGDTAIVKKLLDANAMPDSETPLFAPILKDLRLVKRLLMKGATIGGPVVRSQQQPFMEMSQVVLLQRDPWSLMSYLPTELVDLLLNNVIAAWSHLPPLHATKAQEQYETLGLKVAPNDVLFAVGAASSTRTSGDPLSAGPSSSSAARRRNRTHPKPKASIHSSVSLDSALSPNSPPRQPISPNASELFASPVNLDHIPAMDWYQPKEMEYNQVFEPRTPDVFLSSVLSELQLDTSAPPVNAPPSPAMSSPAVSAPASPAFTFGSPKHEAFSM